MITECLGVVFVNATLIKSPGYDDFIVQVSKVLENVWKSVLNFTHSWQVSLMSTLARWRIVIFVAYLCEYLNSWLGSAHHGDCHWSIKIHN